MITDNILSAKVQAAILIVAYVSFDCFVTTEICGNHCHLVQGNYRGTDQERISTVKLYNRSLICNLVFQLDAQFLY